MTSINSGSMAEAQNDGDHYRTLLKIGGREFISDEPEGNGGKSMGPSPGDYICMALASCRAITLRMYVERKHWNVNTIRVRVNHSDLFHCEIQVTGTLDDEQQKRLVQIANSCPISRLLSQQNEFITTILKI